MIAQVWAVGGILVALVAAIGVLTVWAVRVTLDRALARLVVTSRSVDTALDGQSNRIKFQRDRIDKHDETLVDHETRIARLELGAQEAQGA